MKKVYKKPTIIFEDFSLCTNIAGDCESIVGNPTKGSCPVLGTGNMAIFNDAISACEYIAGQMGSHDDMWDEFCYHVPTEYSSLFNS